MRDRIEAALKEAVKQQDATRICTLRLVLAALKDRETADRDDGAARPLEDAEIIAVLATMVKQREASIRGYEESGQLELAARETDEIAVIRDFLPRPLDPRELDAAIAEAVQATGARTLRDLGRVVGVLKSRYAGRIDFGKVGQQVRAALG